MLCRQDIRGKTESGGALTGGQLLTLLSGGQGAKRREAKNLVTNGVFFYKQWYIEVQILKKLFFIRLEVEQCKASKQQCSESIFLSKNYLRSRTERY